MLQQATVAFLHELIRECWKWATVYLTALQALAGAAGHTIHITGVMGKWFFYLVASCVISAIFLRAVCTNASHFRCHLGQTEMGVTFTYLTPPPHLSRICQLGPKVLYSPKGFMRLHRFACSHGTHLTLWLKETDFRNHTEKPPEKRQVPPQKILLSHIQFFKFVSACARQSRPPRWRCWVHSRLLRARTCTWAAWPPPATPPSGSAGGWAIRSSTHLQWHWKRYSLVKRKQKRLEKVSIWALDAWFILVF